MGHAVLASDLQCRAVHEVQHDRVRQLLAIEIWYVGYPKFGELVFLGCSSLMLHSLRYREGDIASFVDLDYTPFPELWNVSPYSNIKHASVVRIDLPKNRGTEC